MIADEPTHFSDDTQSELQQLRRRDDRRREQQIESMAATMTQLCQKVADLQRNAEMQPTTSEALVERATKCAVAGVFAQIGVDVNNPVQLQAFRDDLRFSAYARESAKKGFYGLMTGVGSALVAAVLYFLSQWGGQK